MNELSVQPKKLLKKHPQKTNQLMSIVLRETKNLIEPIAKCLLFKKINERQAQWLMFCFTFQARGWAKE